MPLGWAHLDEVKLVDVKFAGARVADVADVVAIGGHDVVMNEVTRDGDLGCDLGRLVVRVAALEEQRLDRNRQPSPLPCTRSVNVDIPACVPTCEWAHNPPPPFPPVAPDTTGPQNPLLSTQNPPRSPDAARFHA